MIDKPVLAVSNRGLSVLSEDIKEKLENKKLSPSLVRDIDNCPAAWLANTYVLRDLLPEEPDNPASRGSLFHKVMELLFAFPAEDRTREKINQIVDEVLEMEDFKGFQGNQEALTWLKDTVEGYYTMGGDPQKVKVATYKRKKDEEPKLGLEVFVRGHLGKTKRDVLGFVDRLAEDQRNADGVIVEDWKTGAKAKVWNPKTSSDEGRAEARQQVIYSMILKQDGLKVTGARLIYPAAKKVVPVDIEDESFNQKVIEELTETDEKLTTMMDNNLFPYKPNVLCSWCPLRSICPKAKAPGFQKAREAARKQPSIEVLAPAFEFI